MGCIPQLCKILIIKTNNIATPKKFLINQQILRRHGPDLEIYLIDSEGEALGKMTAAKAMETAQEKGFDLVEVSPLAKPPVCRIIDYGKFLYKIAKQERQQKAKQKKIEVKGIRIRPSTGAHDLGFKLKQTVKFLDEGNKIKIEMILRDREKRFGDLALKKMTDFIREISNSLKEDKIVLEQLPKRNPQGFIAIIAKAKKIPTSAPSSPATPASPKKQS